MLATLRGGKGYFRRCDDVFLVMDEVEKKHRADLPDDVLSRLVAEELE